LTFIQSPKHAKLSYRIFFVTNPGTHRLHGFLIGGTLFDSNGHYAAFGLRKLAVIA